MQNPINSPVPEIALTWTCRQCTLVNKTSTQTCELCESVNEEEQRRISENEWSCRECTFSNPNSSRICSICYSSQVPSSSSTTASTSFIEHRNDTTNTNEDRNSSSRNNIFSAIQVGAVVGAITLSDNPTTAIIGAGFGAFCGAACAVAYKHLGIDIDKNNDENIFSSQSSVNNSQENTTHASSAPSSSSSVSRHISTSIDVDSPIDVNRITSSLSSSSISTEHIYHGDSVDRIFQLFQMSIFRELCRSEMLQLQAVPLQDAQELFDNISNSGGKGMTSSAINRLPIEVVTTEIVSADGTCYICLENFILEQKMRKLPCGHKFHNCCIDRWLKVARTCPSCKHVIQKL